MDFQEKLSEYMEQLNCSAKELSQVTGLSAATLSRYRNGDRTPVPDSEAFEKLVAGIASLAAEQGVNTFSESDVRSSLAAALSGADAAERLAEKLDALIRTLHINIAKMARSMNYDASFFSKIRRGQRAPADINIFSSQLAAFVADNYSDEISLSILSRLIDEDPNVLTESGNLRKKLGDWLVSGHLTVNFGSTETSDFLRKLDEFNLEDYIRVIHFDELKVPTAPFRFPTSRTYRGVEGQKKALVDFLKGVVLSHSKEPLFMYADMDMVEMSEDKDFSKKWMLGLAMILKKEQPIILVHNLNRPFHELMLGLEAYIPLYMTGLVSPYYFKGVQNAVFRHFLHVTGSYALSGEAVAGHHEQGRFFLSNSREEIAYCQERAKFLLEKAYPLMDIYTEEKRELFDRFLTDSVQAKADRHFISSVLPIFTLPPAKLDAIMQAAGIPDTERQIRQECAVKQLRSMEQLLKTGIVLDELPLISREEYDTHPLSLSFAESFLPTIPYSYEDYTAHLEYTKEYAAQNPSYRIRLCEDFAFRNIRIDILKGKWVWISKIASPAIHFVIYQQQLREAIEKMYIAMFD